MNNGLLYFGGLLVVVLAALFAVPNFIDWNGYRGVFEEEASKVLGRDVRVGGSVNLKLLPVPYVRFEKVRIANHRRADGRTVRQGRKLHDVALGAGAAARRARSQRGRAEQAGPHPRSSTAKAAATGRTSSSRPGDLPFVPRDVALRSVKLIDGAISIYNAATERIALFEGIYGELSADGLKGPFRFKGIGFLVRHRARYQVRDRYAKCRRLFQPQDFGARSTGPPTSICSTAACPI